MAEFRPQRQTDAGRPGPQTMDDTGRHPGTPAGQPPAPNPGQTDVGTGYTMLRGGQDVQQPGYYFDEATGEVRFWEKGQTIGHARTEDPWLYLSDERGLSAERARELIRERGYGGALDNLRLLK
jgi:hypothetical protein